jgi:hypothetical protein
MGVVEREREREKGQQRRRGRRRRNRKRLESGEKRNYLRPPAGREEKRAHLAAVDRGGCELRVVGTAAEQQQRGCGR